MKLDKWDEIKPYLEAICLRSNSVLSDIQQIKDWVSKIKTAPKFETEARHRMMLIGDNLTSALAFLSSAIAEYDKKDKLE